MFFDLCIGILENYNLLVPVSLGTPTSGSEDKTSVCLLCLRDQPRKLE